MIFDWGTGFPNAGPNPDIGLGHQHCSSPLGPCTISPVPVNREQNNTPIVKSPGGNKYLASYGGSLFKRSSASWRSNLTSLAPT